MKKGMEKASCDVDKTLFLWFSTSFQDVDNPMG
jgi:hypothetical protein